LSVGTEGGTLPYTYLWQPNGKTTYNISSLTAGTYTVTVTDKAGCSITLSATITQPASALGSVIPTPTCIGSGNGIVTISESGGTGPYTYIWSNGSTKTSMTVSSGTYRVTLHDANGCSATNSVTFLCPNTPGKMGDEGHELNRDYYPANNDVSLYPNPNTGQFTLSGLEKGMIIEMYSYTGRIINSITATDITMQINISAQPNGIYLLRILSEDGTPVSQKKVVKTQ
jgi:hypothetical protein